MMPDDVIQCDVMFGTKKEGAGRQKGVSKKKGEGERKQRGRNSA